MNKIIKIVGGVRPTTNDRQLPTNNPAALREGAAANGHFQQGTGFKVAVPVGDMVVSGQPMKFEEHRQSFLMSPSRDTSREADAVQVELLRLATPERRGQLALMLSDTTRQMARRAIDQASPTLSKRARDLLFVRVHYGRELARDLGHYLERYESE